MESCGPVHDVTDVATDVEVVAPDEVRDFVAAHGGRVFVWVSPHPGGLFMSLPARVVARASRAGATSRSAASQAPGFELYLEGTQKLWPRMLEFALRRQRRVEAYWNGMGWIV